MSDISIYKEIIKDDIFELCHHLGYDKVEWQTHGPICKALESSTRNKLLCVPRGCFKSSIASVVFPIWLLIRNPNLRILIDSELYTNSKNYLREIKAHLVHPRLTSLFGEFKTSVWNESEIIIAQRDIIKKDASISVGGIGTIKTGGHFDVIIGDDLNSQKNSLTPEACQKVIDHYRMYTSLLEPGGTTVIIGTRYSTNDVIGFICENELGLESGVNPVTNIV